MAGMDSLFMVPKGPGPKPGSSISIRRRPKSKSVSNIPEGGMVEFSGPCPKKVFRFFIRISSDNDPSTDAHLVELSTADLDFLGKVDVLWYTPHDHRLPPDPYCRFRNISLSRPFLVSTPHDSMEASFPVAVGPSVFILFNRPYSDLVSFQSINLDGSTGKHLEPPICQNRFFPKGVALDGQLYFLGGLCPRPNSKEVLHFAEVYNPAANKWVALRQPPDADALIAATIGLFIASLGEKQKKIMVYKSEPTGTLYIYSADTSLWESFVCDDLIPGPVPFSMVGDETVNEENGIVYWLDNNCFINEFDCNTRRFSSGPVIGFERDDLFMQLDQALSSVTFYHLWDDFFCVFWCQPIYHPKSSCTTEYHFTFVKVIRDSLRGTFTAFVVGCLMDLFPFKCPFDQAIMVK